jgi:hypothetical protein
MFGSQVLDTGIGLAMLFAFMSLIATSLNEAIETFVKARAKQLEQGIRNILDDPTGVQGIANKFFNSPFITILYSGKYDSTKLTGDSPLEKKLVPSTSARTNAVPISERGSLPSYIPTGNFALAVLRLAANDGAQTIANIQNELSAGNSPLKGTALGKLVLEAVNVAGADIATVKTRIEELYDASMDRVSGWYKRRTQYILFCIGLFAAVVMNVDTIEVTRSLMSDTILRQAVVAHAKNADTEKIATLQQSKDALLDIGLPIGWTNLPQLGKGKAGECNGPMSCIGDLSAAGFEATVSTLASMLLGWLITALAIMLGAPFWFDVLNKIMQLRAAINPDKKK